MWGLVVSTIVSAVGSIILALVLGSSNYGLYGVALAAPTLIFLFQDLGMSYAVVRYSARLKAEGKTAEIRSIFVSGLIFKTLTGLSLSFLCLLIAPYLATDVFHRPLITPLIQIVSFIILANALVSTATAAFTGVEKMHLNSIMLVSQSVIKAILVPALVIVGFSVYGAVVGYTASFLIAALIGLLLVWVIYRSLPSLGTSKLDVTSHIKVLIRFGLPLSFGDIVYGFLTQFYTFLLASYVANNAVIGNYNLASNFVVIILFVSTPINTMLFPAFSKLNADTEQKTLKNVYQSSVKYTTLIVMPVIAAIMALAGPGISTIFGHSYPEAPFDLSVLAINYVFLAFGLYSTINLINSQEQNTIKIILAFISVAVGVPLGIITISRYGVLGLLITIIFDGVPSTIIGLVFIKRRYNTTVDWVSSGKIIFSSALAGLPAYFVIKLPLPSVIQLIIGAAIFLSLFMILIVLTKAIDKFDIVNLREMTRGLGAIGEIVSVFLILIEKLQSIGSRRLDG